MSITLPSGRKIGQGQTPFIIAEVGSNWRTLDDCLRSISQAKQAGADAVKFQAFTAEALYGQWSKCVESNGRTLVHDESQDTFHSIDLRALPLDWLPSLKAKADACGIEFMCSAFSPELIDAVDPFVNIHKVASAELSHVRMLERLAAIGKPVILSTGASGRADIKKAIDLLQPCPVILLYCVAAYPARDIDFRMIDELRQFRFPVGYSDHTTDYGVIPRAAIGHGACVLEKHFTAIEADTPDRPHSLTVDEFKKMIQSIRGERPFVWGSGEEHEMVVRHNRRLVATRGIRAGEALSDNGPGANFGIYRSLKDDTRGISPFAIAQVAGRSATRAIQAGEAIGPGDFA